jgi:hypothetical protein
MIKRFICKIFGHKWEDCSYANTESGNIHLCCKRCGEDYEIILY